MNGQQEKCSKVCPLCNNTTWIEVRVDKRICAYRCECYEKERISNNSGWKKAGLTLETSRLNFTNFEEWNEYAREMKRLGIKYFRNFDEIKESRKNSLIVAGNPGCGKSHLVIAIANNLIKRNLNVVYMPYRETIMEIKQNVMNGEVYYRILNKYKNAQVLLIDDLFKGQINPSDINIMFEIVNYRYMNNLPMLISTEMLIDNIISVDEALGSRIYEMAGDYSSEVVEWRSNYRLKDR